MLSDRPCVRAGQMLGKNRLKKASVVQFSYQFIPLMATDESRGKCVAGDGESDETEDA